MTILSSTCRFMRPEDGRRIDWITEEFSHRAFTNFSTCFKIWNDILISLCDHEHFLLPVTPVWLINSLEHHTHTHTHTHTQKSFSRVQLFATPWIVAHQAPWSMGFSRHEYWSGLPFPQVKWKVPKRMVGAWQALLQIPVNCTLCDFPLH